MNRIEHPQKYLGNIRDLIREEAGQEDRDATIALHRLHGRTGFNLSNENPRRRHSMEDQGYRCEESLPR